MKMVRIPRTCSSPRFVIAARPGIQVTDRVRHTVEERYQILGMDPGFHRGDDSAGMTEHFISP